MNPEYWEYWVWIQRQSLPGRLCRWIHTHGRLYIIYIYVHSPFAPEHLTLTRRRGGRRLVCCCCCCCCCVCARWRARSVHELVGRPLEYESVGVHVERQVAGEVALLLLHDHVVLGVDDLRLGVLMQRLDVFARRVGRGDARLRWRRRVVCVLLHRHRTRCRIRNGRVKWTVAAAATATATPLAVIADIVLGCWRNGRVLVVAAAFLVCSEMLRLLLLLLLLLH